MAIKYLGIKFSKYASRSGQNHWAWKGKNVGYVALHDWITKQLGKAAHCEECGIKEKPPGKKKWFHWACQNGNYTRKLSNWRQLCIKCHRKYDGWREKIGN